MKTTADKIEAAAREFGYSVRQSQAGTGTRYLHLERGDYTVTVRIANHAETYEPKRGERKLSVSPDELTAAQAIKALADPAEIAPYSPPRYEDLSQGEQRIVDGQRKAAQIQQEARKNAKVKWQALRAKLTSADFAEFQARDGNRPAAREMAPRFGVGAGLMWMALTNGKAWQR